MTGFEITVIVLLLFVIGFLWGIVYNVSEILSYLKRRDGHTIL